LEITKSGALLFPVCEFRDLVPAVIIGDPLANLLQPSAVYVLNRKKTDQKKEKNKVLRAQLLAAGLLPGSSVPVDVDPIARRMVVIVSVTLATNSLPLLPSLMVCRLRLIVALVFLLPMVALC
jgi:hypothetical protein